MLSRAPRRRLQRAWLLAVPVALAAPLALAAPPPPLPPLPEPVTNNVVTVVPAAGGEYVVSLLGLGSGKSWRDLRDGGYVHRIGSNGWISLPDVPDGRGRLAAAAATVGGHAYIFGGYTVARDGSEKSTPYVYRLDVVGRRYQRRADMPTPVDDSVALVHQDRYVYLVSGWHDDDNVRLVQLYDAVENRWQQATAWPGTPVFGHAGAITDGRMLVCDGVQLLRERDRGKYAPSDECWLGIIDPEDPARIDWRAVEHHPGLPRYRMAALAHRNRFLFIGGSENPYNYDGIGYDGRPSEPAADALMFDVELGDWHVAGGPAVMDLRALAVSTRGIHVVGGMRAAQAVSAAVEPVELTARR
jgi:hypothetical protein